MSPLRTRSRSGKTFLWLPALWVVVLYHQMWSREWSTRCLYVHAVVYKTFCAIDVYIEFSDSPSMLKTPILEVTSCFFMLLRKYYLPGCILQGGPLSQHCYCSILPFRSMSSIVHMLLSWRPKSKRCRSSAILLSKSSSSATRLRRKRWWNPSKANSTAWWRRPCLR